MTAWLPRLLALPLLLALSALLSLAFAPAPLPRREHDAGFTNSVGMRFVRIKAGTFLMGSDSAERKAVYRQLQMHYPEDWLKGEVPRHEVEITRGFDLGVTE